MPYKSDRQRKFLHARHPDIAKRWDAEHGTKPKPPTAKPKRPGGPKPKK